MLKAAKKNVVWIAIIVIGLLYVGDWCCFRTEVLTGKVQSFHEARLFSVHHNNKGGIAVGVFPGVQVGVTLDDGRFMPCWADDVTYARIAIGDAARVLRRSSGSGIFSTQRVILPR